MLTIALIHTAVTLFMVGVITYVQFVHYPMFRHWPTDRFGAIEAEHQRRTRNVVLVPMTLELLTGALVCRDFKSWWDASALLLLPIWMMTFAVLVPLHERLRINGRDDATLRALAHWNLLRMLLWWIRGVAVMLR
jgi:hypothetical protein